MTYNVTKEGKLRFGMGDRDYGAYMVDPYWDVDDIFWDNMDDLKGKKVRIHISIEVLE